MKSRLNALMHGLAVIAVCALNQSAWAAAGDIELSSSPLIVVDAVEPNVYMMIDGSGSMESEIITDFFLNDLVQDSIPVPQTRPYYYMFPLLNNGREYYWYANVYSGATVHPNTVPSTDSFPTAWVLRHPKGNTLYYDPDYDYEPWPGVDSSGQALYTDADPYAAPYDPNHPSYGTTDLTQDIDDWVIYDNNYRLETSYPASYNLWVDDGDGVFELTDSYKTVEIKTSNQPFSTGRSFRDELQNFANWFTYYRKRSYTAKAVLGRLVNNNNSVRMALRDLGKVELSSMSSMTKVANKEAMLRAIYELEVPCFPGQLYNYDNACSGTPLLRTLQYVGEQFLDASTTPIVSQAEGGECQQNFGIMMTDGYWNDSPSYFSFPNADNDSETTTASIFDGNADQSNDGGNYSDSYSPTLADVAMYYYETDLSGLDDLVPSIADVDEATHQHLVTYTIAFGVNGTFDLDTIDPLESGFSWTDPTTVVEAKVDDLYHAAYNSRALHLSAGSPVALEEAMDAAFKDIADRTATAAAVSINSAKLTTESVVYVAQFNTNRWQGGLEAFKIKDTDTGELSTTAKWNAADELDDRDLEKSPRVIFTHNGRTGVPFLWDNLSNDQKADLKTDSAGNTESDDVGEARLDFIRGDRSNEGQGYGFRERLTILGDIVNSGPIYVGAPSLRWPDYSPFPTGASQYSNFKDTNKDRSGIVYVGANDGMLHGFDESTGEEVLAYVPSQLYSEDVGSGLHSLSELDYDHNYYVDLTPSISDVFINTGSGQLNWETVLISGMRSGGRGVFALNVTDPSDFTTTDAYSNKTLASDTVLWEFTSDDDDDLGFTHSPPQIALANNGRWVAIFGNGYNHTDSGEAVLFILDIEAGINGWTRNDYVKISTGVGTSSDKNGLNTPALVDTDGNGTVDRVYAGDLKGNLWGFDLSSKSDASWGLAYGTGEPLFNTINDEPITSKPVVAEHPTEPDSTSPSNAPNIMVFFGTGKYLGDSDKSNSNTNYFYGVWDKGDGDLDNGDLQQQTYQSGFSGRVLSRNEVDYTREYGWYFDLPDSGERSVTAPVARSNVVFFNTFVPVADPCDVGGYGYRFAVDMETGGSPEDPAIDTNEDGLINDSDRVKDGNDESTIAAIKQDGYLPEPVFIEDISFTAETPSKVEALRFIPTGRFSWQELIQ